MTDVTTAAALAAEHAETTEAAGAVARPVVEALVDAGLMKLWVPARYGGAESDLQTCLDAIAAVGRGDGSAGWAVMIANTTGLLASRWCPEEDQYIEYYIPGTEPTELCARSSRRFRFPRIRGFDR